MEKLKNILFNKVTIGDILLFVQLAWLLLFFYQLSSYSTVITAILGLVSILMMLAMLTAARVAAVPVRPLTQSSISDSIQPEA